MWWQPNKPAYYPLPVTRGYISKGGKDCYQYAATSQDYLSRLSAETGISLSGLLADNIDVVTDLEAPLAGKSIRLCDPVSWSIKGEWGGEMEILIYK